MPFISEKRDTLLSNLKTLLEKYTSGELKQVI